MGWLARTLNILDSFLSWWERLAPSSWNKALVGMVSLYFFGYWAWLTEQPSVAVATYALVAMTCGVFLFTYLPLLLRKSVSPPLLVVVGPPKFPPGQPDFPLTINFSVFIVNRSAQNRMYLELILNIPLSNGETIHSRSPLFPYQSFTPQLDPQKTTSELLHYRFRPPSDGSTLLFKHASLHIVDHVSARSLQVAIPGRFPPEKP